MPVTRVAWVTRATITKAHIAGLLKALEEFGALDYTEVRITALEPGGAVTVPTQAFSGLVDMDLTGLPDTVVIPYDSPVLPAQGLLWVPLEEIDDDPAPPSD